MLLRLLLPVAAVTTHREEEQEEVKEGGEHMLGPVVLHHEFLSTFWAILKKKVLLTVSLRISILTRYFLTRPNCHVKAQSSGSKDQLNCPMTIESFHTVRICGVKTLR